MPRQTPTQDSKNKEMVSSNIGGHQKNVEFISVINFIDETMKTLKST